MISHTATATFYVLLALLAFALPGRSFGQADQGAVTGVIQDTSGALIAHAAVTLRNIDTGLVLNTSTNDDGVYVFSPVKIGSYEVKATAPGFGTSTENNLHLNIQQRMNVSLRLAAGDVSTTVNVASSAPTLQTEDASVGQVLTAKVIDETPLSGRNWVYVAQLTAGVAPSNGSKGPAKGRLLR